MTTPQINDPNALTGAQVLGSDGGKLGKIDAVYFDNDTERPEWVAVKSGLFGGHVSLVPLAQAGWDGRSLSVPFDKAALQNAPHHDPDREISDDDERELYRHYGLDTATTQASGRSATGTPRGQDSTGRDSTRPAELRRTRQQTGTAATARAMPGSRGGTPPGRPPTRR